MSQYSFFSYESHEALHLSLKEQQIIKDLFGKLEYELSQSIDKHSKKLIAVVVFMKKNRVVGLNCAEFFRKSDSKPDCITIVCASGRDDFQVSVFNAV